MKIVRYFPDCDLRNGHQGLFKISIQNKIDVRKLGSGEFLVFVNRAKTQIKMFAGSKVIAHYKSTNGKIDPRVIQHLPNVFSGGDINYDKAMLKVMQNEFGEWQ